MPTPPAAISASTACARETPRCRIMVITAPGRMPQLPAVGLATILPIAALHSATDMAVAIACVANAPDTPPVRAY